MYKVMLVEDDLTNQLFYRKLRVWEEAGFEIAAVADNGKEALEMLSQSKIDLFLVDVMNGFDFLRELKARKVPGQRVIAGSCNEFEYVRQGMKLGACDYLLKPVSPEALRECLMNIRQELDAGAADVVEMIFRNCGADTGTGFTQKLMACFAGREDINQKDIAEAFMLSRDYFGKLFKRQMNENFSRFVLRYKMEYARYLLAETEDRIYEISGKLGYKTPDYFTKLFREYTGETPAQYRKKTGHLGG